MTSPSQQVMEEVLNMQKEFVRMGLLSSQTWDRTLQAHEAQRHWLTMRLLEPGDAPSAEPGGWPLGIVHRSPKAIDADRNGNVQVLTEEGWQLARWDDVVVVRGRGWQHTPLWTLRDRGKELIDQLVLLIGSRQPLTFEMQELLREIRGALRGEP